MPPTSNMLQCMSSDYDACTLVARGVSIGTVWLCVLVCVQML